MKNAVLLLIPLIVGLFQATVLPYFSIFAVKPDLLLICMVVASVFLNWKLALSFSLFAAIIKDIFKVDAFGVNILLYPLWSYAIAKLSRKISINDNFAVMLLVFAVIFSNGIIIRFINLSSGKLIPIGIFLRIVCVESLYAAFLSPFVVMLFNLNESKNS